MACIILPLESGVLLPSDITTLDNLKKNDKTEKLIKTLENEIDTLEIEINDSQRKDNEAYTDKVNGVISLETYLNIRNNLLNYIGLKIIKNNYLLLQFHHRHIEKKHCEKK